MGACSERVELVVETRAEEAFGGVKARGGVGDSFCKVMHVARPVIEMLANSATSAGGSGAGGGCDVGSEGKVVGGQQLIFGTADGPRRCSDPPRATYLTST